MLSSVDIANCIIKMTLADQGSSTDILFWNTLKQMDILEFEILSHNDPLFGFVGEQVGTKGCIWLYTRFGHEGPLQKRLKIQYVIEDAHRSYNILLGLPSLNALGMHANQRTTRECYMASLRLHPHTRKETTQVVHYVKAEAKVEEVEGLKLDPRTNNGNQVTPVEEMTTFQLGPREGHVTQLGNQLPEDDNS